MMVKGRTNDRRLSEAYRVAPELRNAIRLLDWLRAKGEGEISLREIMRIGPYAIRQKGKAEAALAVLEEHFHISRHNAGRNARWTLETES